MSADFFSVAIRVLGTKRVSATSLAILVAGAVMANGPRGTGDDVAIMVAGGFFLLFSFLFFKNIREFPRGQRGPLTIGIFCVSCLSIVLVAHAAIEYITAVREAVAPAEVAIDERSSEASSQPQETSPPKVEEQYPIVAGPAVAEKVQVVSKQALKDEEKSTPPDGPPRPPTLEVVD